MAETNENKNDEDKKIDKDPYNFFKLDPGSGDDDGGNRNKKPFRFPFFTLMIAVVAALAFVNMFLMQKPEELIDFSEFKQLIEDGKIVRVDMGENVFIGYGPEEFSVSPADSSDTQNLKTFPWLRRTAQVPLNRKVYRTTGVLMAKFIEFLDEKGVQYKFVNKQTNILVQILINILPFLILLAIYFFMFRKMTGGMGGLGSVFGGGSRNKAVDEGKVKTRFEDVAGVDEAKDELVEVVDFLKSPKKYTDIGGKIPKGVLLVGPPGTGKTLLARAVAGEAGVPFFSISGSDFVEMFVGVGASRVRDLFDQAKKVAPAIIFIDEIDAVGRQRGSGLGGGHDEREQTLNQLLVEMDGFTNNEGVIVMAATNRSDILDNALLRPGRFDRQVYIGLPDVRGREAILRVHAKGKPLGDDVDLNSIAKGTPGFAGADLENLMNEAAIYAARADRRFILQEDIQKAFVKVGVGTEKKSRIISDREKNITAIHEAGHAIIHHVLPGLDPVHSISIIPTGMAGGYTMPLPEEDTMYLTKSQMENEIVSLLKESITDPENQMIYIAHADCDKAEIESVKEMIRCEIPCREIYVSAIGPIIGASIGPDAVALFAFGQEQTYRIGE